MVRYCQLPVPVSLFENFPVHNDLCPVARQQICSFLVHPCLWKDQSNALFAIKELQRSISFLGCPRYSFTVLKVTSISVKSDTCSYLFLLGIQSSAEKKEKQVREVVAGEGSYSSGSHSICPADIFFL